MTADDWDGPIEMAGTPLQVTIPPNPYREKGDRA